MEENKFNDLCKKIEEAINAAFTYLWHPDNLSNVHSVFFSKYDDFEYRTVYHDGYHISKQTEAVILDSTSSIGEEEVCLDHLRPELEECTPEQLERLKALYCIHMGDSILAYFPVNGIYAVIREEDYDPDVFDCGALPYGEDL